MQHDRLHSLLSTDVRDFGDDSTGKDLVVIHGCVNALIT
jgi:hypothetical protein